MDTGGVFTSLPAVPSSSRTRAGTGTAGSSPASALDGAATWQDGSAGGTVELLAARKFVLLPDPPGHSFTTPTIEFEPCRFLTAYGWYPGGGDELAVNGLFWHLEPGGSGPGGR